MMKTFFLVPGVTPLKHFVKHGTHYQLNRVISTACLPNKRAPFIPLTHEKITFHLIYASVTVEKELKREPE